MAPKALYGRNLSDEGSNPHCLCPLKDVNTNLDQRASMTQVPAGLYHGEYIFECSSMGCGYVGKSVPCLFPFCLTDIVKSSFSSPGSHLS